MSDLKRKSLNLPDLACAHIEIVPYGDGRMGRCAACSDDTFVIVADGDPAPVLHYCSVCYELVTLKDGLVPYHDYPKPCRRVCSGAKKPSITLAIAEARVVNLALRRWNALNDYSNTHPIGGKKSKELQLTYRKLDEEFLAAVEDLKKLMEKISE